MSCSWNILIAWCVLGSAIWSRRLAGWGSAWKCSNPPKQLEPSEELVQDVLTIVTVFAGRLYGQRAKGIIRKRVQTALQECAAIPAEGRDGTSQQDHQTAS